MRQLYLFACRFVKPVSLSPCRQRRKVKPGGLRMGVAMPGGNLDQLGELGGNDDPGDLPRQACPQGKADMISHQDERFFGEWQGLEGGFFTGSAAGQDDGPTAAGDGHIHSGGDRIPPGLVRDRRHHSGGAEDGKTADDPQPGVQGAAGARHAVRDAEHDPHRSCRGIMA